MPALFLAGPGMLELLKLLQDGRFHSGEALGAKLGISRSAIWKQLQGLEAELGIEVFKVPGRGYRLSSSMSLLDAEQISRGADDLEWPVTVEPSVDSTNAEIFRRLDAGARAPFVLLAERLKKLRETDPKKFALFTGRDQLRLGLVGVQDRIVVKGISSRNILVKIHKAHRDKCQPTLEKQPFAARGLVNLD